MHGPGELRLRLTPRRAPLKTWQLFAGCVLIWGTTWHAITYQLVRPGAGVRRRAALRDRRRLRRSPSRLWRGERLRFPLAAHAALRAAGRLSLRRVVRLRLSRRALRRLGAGRGRLLGLAAARRRWARRRCSASPSARRFVVGGVLGAGRCRADLLAGDRAPRGGERGTLGLVLHRRRGAALGGRQPDARAAIARPACRSGRRWASACSTAPPRRRSSALVLGRGFALPTAPSWWLSLA